MLDKKDIDDLLSKLPKQVATKISSSLRKDVSAPVEATPEPQTPLAPKEFTGFKSLDDIRESCVMFDDPVQMLYTIDDELLAGRYNLHPWQVQIMRDFAKETTSDKPFRATVRAANGSGKDRMVLAPCAQWLFLRYPEAQASLTSSSGFQLDTQTDAGLKRLALCANRTIFQNEEIIKINYRHYGNRRNGSIIELFATDEPGKAEGAHPIAPGRQFMLGVSEAKTVEEDIFRALHRCTGFTKRVDASSPGLPIGTFYNNCTRDDSLWKHYHITAFDCPHLSKDYITETAREYGEDSSFYKSMILAEFGSDDDNLVVIGYLGLYKLYKLISEGKIQWIREQHNTGGLDLAMGGDEIVLVIRNGNKVIGIERFRMTDANEIEQHLSSLFSKWELNNEQSSVYADAGGLGAPIINHLRRMGYENVRYVTNQSAASNKFAYYNKGAENWFHMKRLIELGIPILPEDEKLRTQLANRPYKIAGKNQSQLLSKQQMKAAGFSSPDRADALVLAFSNYDKNLSIEGSFKDSVVITRLQLEEEIKDMSYRTMRQRLEEHRKGSDLFGGHQNTVRRSNREHLQYLLDDLRTVKLQHK